MSVTTRDNTRWALRNSFLTKESFWCFYIAFKDKIYFKTWFFTFNNNFVIFLYQYFERNGKQAWARKLTAGCLWFLPMGYHLCPYSPHLSDFSRESLIFFYFLVLFCSHPSIIRNCHSIIWQLFSLFSMINRSNLLSSISWPVRILKCHSIIIIIIMFFFFCSSHLQVLREATSFLGSGCAY